MLYVVLFFCCLLWVRIGNLLICWICCWLIVVWLGCVLCGWWVVWLCCLLLWISVCLWIILLLCWGWLIWFLFLMNRLVILSVWLCLGLCWISCLCSGNWWMLWLVLWIRRSVCCCLVLVCMWRNCWFSCLICWCCVGCLCVVWVGNFLILCSWLWVLLWVLCWCCWDCLGGWDYWLNGVWGYSWLIGLCVSLVCVICLCWVFCWLIGRIGCDSGCWSLGCLLCDSGWSLYSVVVVLLWCWCLFVRWGYLDWRVFGVVCLLCIVICWVVKVFGLMCCGCWWWWVWWRLIGWIWIGVCWGIVIGE